MNVWLVSCCHPLKVCCCHCHCQLVATPPAVVDLVLQAVPCGAFCEALCAANPTHSSLLRGLLPWYDTPGTPCLTISSSYSPATESLTLTVRQRNDTAKEIDKALHQPMLIPLKV